MARIAELHRAVQSTLASKRLGTPVFVRYLWQGREKAAGVVSRLALLTALVRDWLGQPLHRLYALGSPQGGQVSLTLECRRGATALVCWSAVAEGGPKADLFLVGNHGALYHDAGLDHSWEDEKPAVDEKPDAALLALIERALRSGQPEGAEGGN